MANSQRYQYRIIKEMIIQTNQIYPLFSNILSSYKSQPNYTFFNLKYKYRKSTNYSYSVQKMNRLQKKNVLYLIT